MSDLIAWTESLTNGQMLVLCIGVAWFLSIPTIALFDKMHETTYWWRRR